MNTDQTANPSTRRRPRSAPADAKAPRHAVEEADLLAGKSGVRIALVQRGLHNVVNVAFSVVGSRAVFEGDIDLGMADELAPSIPLKDIKSDEMQSVVISDTSKRWPLGRVPYEPPPASSPIAQIVQEAIASLTRSAGGVIFTAKQPTDGSFLVFEVSAFCSSKVGRAGGRQVIHLSPDATAGNAIHELCHALGLWHEQSRSDRDAHVRILWANILAGYEHNFQQQLTDGDDVGPYDFQSIMHYPPDAFSANGQPTLQALNGSPIFGQRDQLSAGDVAALRKMYGDANPMPAGTDTAVHVAPVVNGEASSGVQFEVTIQPESVARVVTSDWRSDRHVLWDVVPIAGPSNSKPLLEWRLSVGLSTPSTPARPGHRVNYYFTITNLSDHLVTAQVRYITTPS